MRGCASLKTVHHSIHLQIYSFTGCLVSAFLYTGLDSGGEQLKLCIISSNVGFVFESTIMLLANCGGVMCEMGVAVVCKIFKLDYKKETERTHRNNTSSCSRVAVASALLR